MSILKILIYHHFFYNELASYYYILIIKIKKMNKKILALLSVVALLGLASCGEPTQDVNTDNNQAPDFSVDLDTDTSDLDVEFNGDDNVEIIDETPSYDDTLDVEVEGAE